MATAAVAVAVTVAVTVAVGLVAAAGTTVRMSVVSLVDWLVYCAYDASLRVSSATRRPSVLVFRICGRKNIAESRTRDTNTETFTSTPARFSAH